MRYRLKGKGACRSGRKYHLCIRRLRARGGRTGLHAALPYVALNPARARLAARPEDRPWSSVRAHCARAGDHVVRVAPALERIGDFRALLGEEFGEAFAYAAVRKAESLGRPLASREWLAAMEAQTGLALMPARRGPNPRAI